MSVNKHGNSQSKILNMWDFLTEIRKAINITGYQHLWKSVKFLCQNNKKKKVFLTLKILLLYSLQKWYIFQTYTLLTLVALVWNKSFLFSWDLKAWLEIFSWICYIILVFWFLRLLILGKARETIKAGIFIYSHWIFSGALWDIRIPIL